MNKFIEAFREFKETKEFYRKNGALVKTNLAYRDLSEHGMAQWRVFSFFSDSFLTNKLKHEVIL